MTIKTLAIDQISLMGNTQPRVELDQWLVGEYQEAYVAGVAMPPLAVMFDGSTYWLVDGFHRRFAANNAGLTKIKCHVTTGTLDDARWASYAANQSHGLRRSSADKAKAVKAALRHPKGSTLSDSLVAAHVGVSDKTVAKYRAELESTSEIPRLESTVGRDGKQRKRPRSKPAPTDGPEQPLCANCGTAKPVDGQHCQACLAIPDDLPEDDMAEVNVPSFEQFKAAWQDHIRPIWDAADDMGKAAIRAYLMDETID